MFRAHRWSAVLYFIFGLLARLPLPVLYGLVGLARRLAFGVLKFRRRVVAGNLAACFPELDAEDRDAIRREFERHVGDLFAEIIRGARLSRRALLDRVELAGFDAVTRDLESGTPVIVAAAHQCNWEWLLLRLLLASGWPVEAAYKPLHDAGAERFMASTRARFGARMLPAKTLLPDVLRAGRVPRIVALVADQEPVTAERRYWTRFMNRDTAFYCGLGEVARVTRYPVYFAGMERNGRGRYRIAIAPLVRPEEQVTTSEITERYARAVEAQIRARPAEWLWTNRRWKLKKGLYD